MDINSLLNGRQCACGKDHRCDIRYVYIEKNACRNLKEIMAEFESIILVADENTFAAAGEKTIDALGEKIKAKVIFSGDRILVPNEEAVKTVEAELSSCDAIIAIGSGVIQDLCKFVANRNGIKYAVVATAPSMDGYASDGAAMILGGMKVTKSCRLPIAIVADTEVLKNAPMDMIKAGYGDILGKYSALNDWKLSKIINNEYFCPWIYDTTLSCTDATLKLAKGLLKRDEESVKTLMEALVTVGIMMKFATTSRPASGSEHHLSHYFEITGILNSTPYLCHGLDVAYSAYVTAFVRERLLEKDFSKTKPYSENELIADMKDQYGVLAESCIELQEKAGFYKADRSKIYKDKEALIKEVLRLSPTASQIKEMLSDIELDINDFFKFYSKAQIENAVLYAKDLKDRFTVLWLNFDIFGTKEPLFD